MAEPDDSSMRASDADREAVAEHLRVALGEGRLTLVEYDERVQRAYAAVTLADLAALTTDLPAPESAPTPVAEPRARSAEVDKSKGDEVSKEWREWSGTAFVLVAIWLVTSIAAGGPLFFWPLIPMGIWAAVLVAGMLFGDDSKGS